MSSPRHRPHPLRRGRTRPHRPQTGTGTRNAGESRPALLGIDPPAPAVDLATRYLDRMLEENQRLNLTGIRDRTEALALHVADSLHVWAVAALPPRIAIDIGSGNGFPGVAVACLWPEARVVLVERTGKKAAAIRRCLDDVGLERVETLAADAAQLPALHRELRGAADLVVSRATASLAKVTELAAPLLRRDRALVVQWKAAQVDPTEREDGVRAARNAGLQPREDHVYVLPGDEARARRLVCFVRA